MNEVERAKQRLREAGDQAEQTVRTSLKGAVLLGTLGAATLGVLAGSGSLRLLGRKRSSLGSVLTQLTAATALARQVMPLVAEMLAKRRERAASPEDQSPADPA